MDEPAPSLEELQEKTKFNKSKVTEILDRFLSSYYQQERNSATEEAESHSSSTSTPPPNIMVPSYVSRLPTGSETGIFLSLGLNNTNVKITAVKLMGHGEVELKQHRQLEISDNMKVGSAEDFFDWIASNVKELELHIRQNNDNDKDDSKDDDSNDNKELLLYMCVNCNFPIRKTGVNQGVFVTRVENELTGLLSGNNIVELLQAAFNRKGVDINIVATVNDVISILVANAYKDQNTIISAILDDYGTNAACICTTSLIIKGDTTNHIPGYMIVNTEWGSIGDGFLPFLKYDKILFNQLQQQTTPINGYYRARLRPFERMVAGVYLGELVRLTIVDYVESFKLFDGVLPIGMEVPYSLSSSLISEIESDRSSDSSGVLKVLLKNFEFSDDKKPTTDDLMVVRKIVECYSRRSAQLFAIAVSSLIKLQCPDFPSVERTVIVAVDGSTYNNYYEFSNSINKFLRDLQNVRKDEKIKLSPIENGDSIGAAVIAMMYSH